MTLQPLAESQRLYRQIADRLRAHIVSGEIGPGERLPAERDLSKQLGVSRPSVREALIALEVEGWVEVRVGSGVFVLERAAAAHPSVPAAEWGPLELIRARRAIEGEIAALAATHAKRKHLQAINDAIDLMREEAEEGVTPLAGDRAFHLAIAQATDNAVLVDTVQSFWVARRGPLFERLGDYFENAPSWRVAIAEHERIYEAIRSHDAQAARDAMQAHMDKSHARFSASWKRANPSKLSHQPATTKASTKETRHHEEAFDPEVRRQRPARSGHGPARTRAGANQAQVRARL